MFSYRSESFATDKEHSSPILLMSNFVFLDFAPKYM
jgi:hypothetical protein